MDWASLRYHTVCYLPTLRLKTYSNVDICCEYGNDSGHDEVYVLQNNNSKPLFKLVRLL